MSELHPNLVENDLEAKSGKLFQDDVDPPNEQSTACASDSTTKTIEGELPAKKRKTRRGKTKRRHPYLKNPRKSNKLVKPEAPHNSNQFLLEDHAIVDDLVKNLMSPNTLRTRDSSFSVDSEGDFYSSPDDEQQFLIKDFDDQYESLQAERLQGMSKSDLIAEYLALENKLEQLTKSQQKEEDDSEDSKPDLKQEIERLTMENERLRRENDLLRNKVNIESDSEDSETDSSDSCSSSSTSSSNSSRSSSRSRSPITNIDYKKTNGFTKEEPVP
ncbi:protein HEXIM1 [Diabrotica virgifera virgifera]|uniref:Protein HEXIM n=1 Tax=Diabrotica virgifera virgifera TaxID=50390 RepID=A0A6P7F8K5_DIAVI|nr:protein HEXIM1 [Diabrotica virgifera virgifera]